MKIWLVRLQKVLPDFHTFSVMCMRDNIYQNFILCGGGGVGVLGRMGGGGVSKLVAGPTFQNILPKFHTFSVSRASCSPDFTIIIQIYVILNADTSSPKSFYDDRKSTCRSKHICTHLMDANSVMYVCFLPKNI